MGPPPFGDGDSSRIRDVSPWTYRLQWGHRLSAMEIRRPGLSRLPLDTLQWGHRLSAMEMMFRSLTVGRRLLLQWGHRLSAMEMVGPVPHHGAVEGASMGPPPFGDGDVRHCNPSLVGQKASMGPPPFGDGDGV